VAFGEFGEKILATIQTVHQRDPKYTLPCNLINFKDIKRSMPTINKIQDSTHCRADGFACDDNSEDVHYINGYTCLQVKLATFFHLDNEPLK